MRELKESLAPKPLQLLEAYAFPRKLVTGDMARRFNEEYQPFGHLYEHTDTSFPRIYSAQDLESALRNRDLTHLEPLANQMSSLLSDGSNPILIFKAETQDMLPGFNALYTRFEVWARKEKFDELRRQFNRTL